MAGTNSKCLFYRGVLLIEESVKRESTVCEFSSELVLVLNWKN